MKTIKHYWKRFWSNTPHAIKRLQLILGALAAGCYAMITYINQSGMIFEYKDLIESMFLISTGGVTFLQFTTNDKNLTDDGTEDKQ